MSTDTLPEAPAEGAQAAPPDHAGQPPEAQLFMLLASKWLAQCVHALAKLKIADLLAAGPRSVEDLAATTGMHAPSLRRVLRATAIVNIFAEQPDGRVALTPQAAALRSDVPGSMHAFAVMIGEDALWRPYGDIIETIRTGRPAFDRVHGTSIYRYLAAHQDLATVFDDAMTALSAESAHLYLDSHDFGGYGTIADIGGGRGLMLGEILRRNPSARGVLLELPHVIAQAKPVLEEAGVADRVELVGGDFFAAVPSGADAYLLKTVLHNWNDDNARQILARVREAIGESGATLLVLEDVLQPLNAWDVGKLVDIDMLVTAGGRGRTRQDWAALFASASFELVVPDDTTEWTVLEGRPV